MDDLVFTEPTQSLAPFAHDAFVAPSALTASTGNASVSPRSAVGKRMQQLRRQVRFLQAYVECCGVMAAACEAAKVTRTSVHRWEQEDGAFAGLMRQAVEDARDRVEQELVRRAVNGIEKPVYYKGRKVDTVREYSDVLLTLLMKQRRPSFAQAEKAGGSTTHVNVNALVVPIERLSDEQFRLLEQIYDKAGPPIQEVPVPGQKGLMPVSERVVEVEGA